MKRVFACVLALSLAASFAQASAASVQPSASQPAVARRVVFEYHSAFLMNLHHFLYDAAFLQKSKIDTMACASAPSAEQMQTLREGVAFYRASYAGLGLLDDPTMVGIKKALRGDDQRLSASGLALPPALVKVLNAAGPLYAQCRWEVDDRSNQAWIRQARAMDAVFGAPVQASLEQSLAHRFVGTPIRVDAVVDTGDFRGAYTDEQIIMPSGRADYQGLAVLEMLYHEATHVAVMDTVVNAIDARRTALHRSGESNVWHAVQFYTVGKTVQNVLKQKASLDYQPYAEARGLFTRGWADVAPALQSAWLPHMQGKASLQQAVDHLLDLLPNG